MLFMARFMFREILLIFLRILKILSPPLRKLILVIVLENVIEIDRMAKHAHK